MIGLEVARNLMLALLLYGTVLYLSGGTRAQQDLREAARPASEIASSSTVGTHR